jgi:hypothetical protein
MIVVWLAAMVLLHASPAAGDGIYIPEQAVPTLPAIPTQRAMIVYRNGEETLVVESTFQSPSRDVGWILPVPAEPTKLELGEPGMLTSLSMSLRPSVTDELPAQIAYVAWAIILGLPVIVAIYLSIRTLNSTIIYVLVAVAAFFFLWGLVAYIIAPEFDIEFIFTALVVVPLVIGLILFYVGLIRTVGDLIAGFLIVLYYLFFLAISLSATIGRPSSPMVFANVEANSSQRIGDYDVKVISARDTGALSGWLTDNGLAPLGADALPIVNDYIARKWCFLVAHLSSDATGPATPAPIVATFPAAAPVYPMRLTALAGTISHVELMVVADRQAQIPGFHCVAADRFHSRLWYGGPQSDQVVPYRTRFYAENTRLNIGSPEVCARLWDDCTVTKLVADLAPSAMNQDVSITLADLPVHQDHAFSFDGRTRVIIVIALWGALLVLFYSACIFSGRRRPSRVQAIGLPAIILAVAAAVVVVYKALPVVPAQIISPRTDPSTELLWGLSSLVDDGVLTTKMDHDHLDAVHAKLQAWNVDTNPYTGEQRRMESSPGNFNLVTIDGKTCATTFDENGVPVFEPYPRPKKATDTAATRRSP